MLFLSGDTDIFVKAWCVRVLNTDFTDLTDKALSPVMRRF